MQKLLSPPEVAQILGVSVETLAIWRCTKRYNLPFCKVGRSVRYQEADVNEFIQSRYQRIES